MQNIKTAIDSLEQISAHRLHLGASELGNKCSRAIWLRFRWARQRKIDARLARLFRVGSDAESPIVADLVAAGYVVHSQQMQVLTPGHVAGSIDGILEKGGKRALLEIKTHNKSRFSSLQKSGVQEAFPSHYAQVQTYASILGLENIIYLAICKDNSEIYTELLTLDQESADAAIKRAEDIATKTRLPPGISNQASWFECKICDFHAFCHVRRLSTEINCRTCAAASSAPDGSWHCEQWGASVPVDAQLAGCDSHILHPDLVPWPEVAPWDLPWNLQHDTPGLSISYAVQGAGYVRSGEGGLSSKVFLKMYGEK